MFYRVKFVIIENAFWYKTRSDWTQALPQTQRRDWYVRVVFSLEPVVLNKVFFVIDFNVVKRLQSDFVTFCSDVYRSLSKSISISLRSTIVFSIILYSVLGALVGQVTKVLVGKHHLIIRVIAVYFRIGRSKGNRISGSFWFYPTDFCLPIQCLHFYWK